jgi:hypothetical protein
MLRCGGDSRSFQIGLREIGSCPREEADAGQVDVNNQAQLPTGKCMQPGIPLDYWHNLNATRLR